MRRFILEPRLASVSAVSIAATLAGFVVVVVLAQAQGLDARALTGDAKGYIYLAENLLEHRIFSVAQEPPFYPESFRSPGYPFFLAILFGLFGYSLMALFAHAAIMSLAPVLLFLLVRPLHERAAFWSAIAYALDPVRLFLASSFLSDAFFAVLLLGTVLALTRVSDNKRPYVVAVGTGILLGASILVRPIAIFLPLFFALFLIMKGKWSTRAFAGAILCIVGTVIVVVPWSYRNHALFGSWNVSSVGAVNLMVYNAPEFLRSHPDSEGEARLAAFSAEQSTLPRETAISLERSSVFTSAFRDIIRGREVSYAVFHVLKTIPFFVTDGLRDTIRLFHIDIGVMPNISSALMRGDFSSVMAYVLTGGLPIILLILGSGFWGAVTLLYVVVSLQALIRGDLTELFFAGLIAYFALLTGPVSNARYREAVAGFLLALAALVVLRLYDARHV